MTEERRRPGDSDLHRQKRGKNLALLGALLAFIVLVYIVAIVRMGS
ncbi:hypothetical protein ABWI00_17705 [Algihabitans albus]